MNRKEKKIKRISVKRIPKTPEGILNTYIDQTFHPFFHEDKTSIVIDTALHFIVEQNFEKSVKKFLRYSLKHFL